MGWYVLSDLGRSLRCQLSRLGLGLVSFSVCVSRLDFSGLPLDGRRMLCIFVMSLQNEALARVTDMANRQVRTGLDPFSCPRSGPCDSCVHDAARA